jgi:IS30 family transposase
MSQGEVDIAVELYANGLSLQKIGDQLGWDHNTIYRQLKRRGVVMRGASDWKYE